MPFLGTSATMVACINHLVAGAGVALLVMQLWSSGHALAAVAAGVLAFAVLTALFLVFQLLKSSNSNSKVQ